MRILSGLILALFFQITFSNSNLEIIFTNIYNNHLWSGGSETVSGSGSTLLQTQSIRKRLPILLKKFNIKVLLDVPCGDFNWMNQTDLSCLDMYIGIDIVKELIENNVQKYSSDKRIFLNLDAAKDSLPYADLILCKDLFLHLTFDYIFQVIENFKKTNATYLLVSTYDVPVNNDRESINSGYRPVNLQKAPFFFPEPILMMEDFVTARKYLGLWKISDLAGYGSRNMQE